MSCMPSRAQTQPLERLCPICAKPTVEQFKPFCSRRCADVDLNRWLSGVYAAPAVEAEGDVEIEPTDDESPRRHE